MAFEPVDENDHLTWLLIEDFDLDDCLFKYDVLP